MRWLTARCPLQESPTKVKSQLNLTLKGQARFVEEGMVSFSRDRVFQSESIFVLCASHSAPDWACDESVFQPSIKAFD